MREILFRGKRKDNGEWVQGSLLIHKTFVDSSKWQYEIVFYNERKVPEQRYVIPETVGQYTGLPDKNGEKIFDGDIVLWCGIKGAVVWDGHKFYIKSNLLWDFSHDDCIEVIGNIHDNPELLGGDVDA